MLLMVSRQPNRKWLTATQDDPGLAAKAYLEFHCLVHRRTTILILPPRAAQGDTLPARARHPETESRARAGTTFPAGRGRRRYSWATDLATWLACDYEMLIARRCAAFLQLQVEQS